MKVAVLADIHGNLEAFQSVIADLKQQGAERIISLGDNVGYGPDPEKVVRLLQQIGCESVLGNHEFALNDERGRRWLNFQAAENNIETEKLLSLESMVYCCNLPPCLKIENACFVHGFPPTSVFRYLNKQSDEKIRTLFSKSSCSLYFVGHTHELQMVAADLAVVRRRSLAQECFDLSPDKKYIISAGSVGQPRGGDYRAKYLLWDSLKSWVEVRFVDYDNELTKEKIRQRGFPEAYAIRLLKR